MALWAIWHQSRFFRSNEGLCCIPAVGCNALMTMPPKLVVVNGDGQTTPSAAERVRLERMFVAYHMTVWRTLRRRGLTPEAAADATQEAFIVASRRLSDIPPDSERAFLLGTALRMAHTLRRKTTRWALDEDMDQHVAQQHKRD